MNRAAKVQYALQFNGANKVRHTLRLNGELWSCRANQWEHPIVEAGCIREFTLMPYPEMGEMLGISHSTAQYRVKRFNSLPWRDRYAWLSLVAETIKIGERGVRNITEANL